MAHPTILRVPPLDPRARAAVNAYLDELARRLPEGFDVSRSPDPDPWAMEPPQGTFLLALGGDDTLGCVGLKGLGAGAGEVKRLWIAPSTRGLGLGRRLMAAVEADARALGLTRLCLDTNRALPEAEGLYRATGWVEVPRYNDNPYAEVFFEKRL